MTVSILTGDCREVLRGLPAESVHCVVTSPPYFGLRDYGVTGQIGLEPSPEAFVAELAAVFDDVRRALRDDGTVWLNLGDSYANDGKWGGHTGGKYVNALHCSPIGRNKRYTGLKPKDLIGIPWRVAFALQAHGWWLRQWQPWVKRNPMPESTKDRPTSSIETVFLLSKSEAYFYDYDAVKQVRASDEDANGFRGGAYTGGNIDNSQMGKRAARGNKRVDKQRGHSRRHAGFNDRWDEMERSEQIASRAFRNSDLFFASIASPHGAIGNGDEIIAFDVATQPFKEGHFATFPPNLIEPMIKAGCPAGGTILDPFGGAGTTGMVADRLGRNAILIELNPEYAAMAERRIKADAGLFATVNS